MNVQVFISQLLRHTVQIILIWPSLALTQIRLFLSLIWLRMAHVTVIQQNKQTGETSGKC